MTDDQADRVFEAIKDAAFAAFERRLKHGTIPVRKPPVRPRGKAAAKLVYFIRQGDNGPIKIGLSTHGSLPMRLSALQAANPERLVLLATQSWDRFLEAHLHEEFSEDRLLGEWFRPSDRLLRYIDGIVGT